VNSINWARVMAQTVYYFTAVRALGRQASFSVPTGNFGNVLAGWIARQMGADVHRLIVGSNSNDILTVQSLLMARLLGVLSADLRLGEPRLDHDGVAERAGLAELLLEDQLPDLVHQLLHLMVSFSVVNHFMSFSRVGCWAAAHLAWYSGCSEGGVQPCLRQVRWTSVAAAIM